MHIKEICLEGFKSYATRTVVPGFDPHFNAITGLNGSGKPNILDSICFVLGITNLQQVRAANLQELVYKQGQAGITKATVSITFDNSDRSRSPLGYEDHSEITVNRQTVVGGRNKYLINGKLAQPSQVPNLFHSVQLNVNNPHFLIMQGRITKVLNMKPPEILSMLEEAAGTRMYETKKEAALKTLEKKQTKGNCQIVHNIEDLKKSLEEKTSALKKSEEGAADLKQRVQEFSTTLEECEKEHQGVLAGKSSGDEEKCLEDQLRDAKVAVGKAETELKQLTTKIGHCEKELKEKKSQLMSKREEAAAVENELKARKNDVGSAKKSLESLPYKEGQMEALEKDRASELEIVQKMKDKARDLSAQLANVNFTYCDPVKNFDRSKVKGVVAKLIKVKDRSTMTALEVTAGGKLFNVVVNTEDTGKQLLQKGGLRRRVTTIPLNKIQSHLVQGS
ncbi:PREDICTED: structural maintenance of chromosomes protein 2-2-like isoform X3 [Tarenaya hassleriana]|uniref:structural maintenance of chromosomes protein 2-2-like isoform X3 n=1 Tax=Tarenaya hassleriana TaxID=28532 RepID=UPI00053C4680|nr:PREDICTED: structural maintenance of chromosomes protein 2-2-like isoform X3 [Tarenaya hassleriana]